jgi:hypothetical protein
LGRRSQSLRRRGFRSKSRTVLCPPPLFFPASVSHLTFILSRPSPTLQKSSPTWVLFTLPSASTKPP